MKARVYDSKMFPCECLRVSIRARESESVHHAYACICFSVVCVFACLRAWVYHFEMNRQSAHENVRTEEKKGARKRVGK